MATISESLLDSEEGIFLDASTAPTTPDGSLSFSPVLQAIRSNDSLDEEFSTSFSSIYRSNSRSLSSTILENAQLRPIVVRNICCVGAGYVGGPTASVIALHNPGIKVTVVDRDPGRIRRWNSRHPPVFEPGLREIVRVARDGSKEFTFGNDPIAAGHSDGASDVSTLSSECGSQCDHHAPTITVAGRQPNLFFSTDVAKHISEAEIVLVAVNTPTKSCGQGAGQATDMASFEAVTAVVAQHARPGAIIVEKSTVPCRTAQLVKDTLAAHRPAVHFEILSNPEFLAAGTAVNDLLRPDRVLIGSSPSASGRRAAEALANVYAAWVPRSRIITTNVWSSELAKLVANSMLAQRISSINSISAICEKTGADVDEVAASIGCDPRIGDKFLKAGVGFGGSCFKKDILSLVYLAESMGLEEVGEYWRQVVKMNEYQRDRFYRRIMKCLNNTLVGKKITIFGYAFKKDTSDTRESPALAIIRTFLEERPKEIAIFDPCCNPLIVQDEIRTLLGAEAEKAGGGPIAVYENAYEACNATDAIIIMTEFDEFRVSRSTPRSTTPQGFLPTARSGGVAAKMAPAATRNPDPRPFERPTVTESELLDLQKCLSKAAAAASGGVFPDDPLHRFYEEPGCDGECPDCKQESDVKAMSAAFMTGGRRKERLDWAKIAYHMRKPKWLFDGRGIIEPQELAKFGVRVETVGRQGRRN